MRLFQNSGLYPSYLARLDTLASKPFGFEERRQVGKSKIVLNGAIDMAGPDRGNMRCFEAMGCGALLLSDAGRYPDGMKPNVIMETYDSAEQAVGLISRCLDGWSVSAEMAARGRKRVSEIYSKSLQWKQFVGLVARI